MPKALCLSAFHDINAMPKYAILRIKNRKNQNQKLKNLGERSVRVPNLVKRGCARLNTTTTTHEKRPHYKYNVTHRQTTHQKQPHTPPKTRLKRFIYRYFSTVATRPETTRHDQIKTLSNVIKPHAAQHFSKANKAFKMLLFCRSG